MAAATTPISTCYTYLMHKATSAATQYTKLCDIKSFPDLGGEPERIDVTSLSDEMRQYVPGVQDISSSTFSANYVASNYIAINSLSGKQTEFAIWIGATKSGSDYVPTGSNGKWEWTGDIMAYKTGGDVNAAQEMTIVTFPSTKFAFSVPT